MSYLHFAKCCRYTSKCWNRNRRKLESIFLKRPVLLSFHRRRLSLTFLPLRSTFLTPSFLPYLLPRFSIHFLLPLSSFCLTDHRAPSSSSSSQSRPNYCYKGNKSLQLPSTVIDEWPLICHLMQWKMMSQAGRQVSPPPTSDVIQDSSDGLYP